jgi:hypothetical protein
MIEKQDTIAATMRKFMESGPSVSKYPNYKTLNDAVGALFGLKEGKCQALAGEKAWAWTPDKVSGKWRKATAEEFAAKQAAAAQKNHGTRKSKVMGDAERAALDAQIAALETIDNPALAPLLADLKARQAADDAARKGSLKDRLAAAIEALGIERAVELLEEAVANAEAPLAD